MARKTAKRNTKMRMKTVPRRKTMPGRKLNPKKATPARKANPTKKAAPKRNQFEITGRGLVPTKKIALRKGMKVFMGASSSPGLIEIIKLEKDKIHYRGELDDRTRVIERWIGEDLIVKGTRTWLRSGYPKHHPDFAKKLRKLVKSNPAAKKTTPARKANPKRGVARKKSNPSIGTHLKNAKGQEGMAESYVISASRHWEKKDLVQARQFARLALERYAAAAVEYGHAHESKKASQIYDKADTLKGAMETAFRTGKRRANPKKATPSARKTNPKRRVAKKNPRRLSALTKI